MIVDLTAIPDPDEVSLPPIHPGDLGLGDPFWVMCESVEAVHLISGSQLMVGCDNNLPNSGRNPALPDDNEFIVVNVPGMGRCPEGSGASLFRHTCNFLDPPSLGECTPCTAYLVVEPCD